MNEIILKLYKNYGDYCNYRCFPLDIDGLKPVERRTLLSVYQVAKDQFVKSARIDGHTIFHYHPHGSVYGTLEQLVHQGFVIGQGNWGSKLGTDESEAKCAAMRYTECCLSNHMINLTFNLINYVPWEALDLDKEPLYFPAMFPLCLLGNEYTSGIGFGYRTIIPCYKIKDLHRRLLYLLGITKKKPIIKPISNCEILASDEELERLLTVGRSKIKIKGIYTLNNQDFTIKLKSWPGSFEKLKNKKQLQNDIENFDISDLSSAKVGTEIIFELNKQRNRELLFNRFVEKFDKFLNGSVPFDIIVTDSNWNVRRASVDELLLKSYNNYFETTKTMMNSKIKDYNDLKEEYLALLKIRPVLSKCIKGKNQIIVDEIIKEIHEKTSVSEEMIKLLFSKYRINKLLTLNVDIEEIENKIKEYENNLENITQYILDKYSEVVK